MKLEKAYSLDLEKNITATEADVQFQNGSVNSKFDFKCPDKNCDAHVTCANLDRAKSLRKRDPYYKVFGDHSSDCLIAKDIESQPLRNQQYDIYSLEDKHISGAVRVNLQPPSTKKNIPSDGNSNSNNGYSAYKSSSNSTTQKREIQKTKTLSSIVDSFLNEKSILFQFPNIDEICTQELFIEIDGQDIYELPDEWRIYYGKAWFNLRNNGYAVVFDKKLVVRGISKRPSFFISISALGNSGFAKFNQE